MIYIGLQEPTKKVDAKLIQKIAAERNVTLCLDPKWINERIEEAWSEYTQKKVNKGSTGLPSDMLQLFDITNEYLTNITIIAK